MQIVWKASISLFFFQYMMMALFGPEAWPSCFVNNPKLHHRRMALRKNLIHFSKSHHAHYKLWSGCNTVQLITLIFCCADFFARDIWNLTLQMYFGLAAIAFAELQYQQKFSTIRNCKELLYLQEKPREQKNEEFFLLIIFHGITFHFKSMSWILVQAIFTQFKQFPLKLRWNWQVFHTKFQ